MSDQQMKLAGEFDTPTWDDWKAVVEKALKGAPFEKKLFSQTYENIQVRPVYTGDDWKGAAGLPGMAPYTRGVRASGSVQGWDIRQLHAHPDPVAGNNAILEDLERGVTSLLIRFDKAARSGLGPDGEGAGEDGAMIYSVEDLEALLDGVQLDLAPVALEGGAAFSAAAQLLKDAWSRAGLKNDQVEGAFGADPLGVLATEGTLPQGLKTALKQMAELAGDTAKSYPNVQAVRVNTEPYYSAGASDAQDLACALATGVAYLRAMTDAGLSTDQAMGEIVFSIPTGTDFFMGIAKLRAARKLWGKVAESCGAKDAAMTLHAMTARRVMSKRDPWVNMLRTTVTCFAGGIGGADAVTVLPFDAALGLPDGLARRIARNTQIILQEESNVARVIDPAGGSWYLEQLTDQMAAQAWTFFQEIEKQGGMADVLASGWLAEQIEMVHVVRMNNIARRKDALTGVNEFPNIQEKDVVRETVDIAVVKKAATERAGAETIASLFEGGAATTITPMPAHRLPEEFEALRDASDAYQAKTGSRPKIFLVNLGKVAQHTARASYAKNFFEAGGIETISNDGFFDADAAAKAFEESDAEVAILCGGDAQYEEMVADFAPAIKGSGAKTLFLAGHPGEKIKEYKKAGVDAFIGVGSNVLEILKSTLSDLGVK